MLNNKNAPRNFGLIAVGLMLSALVVTLLAGFSFSVAVMMLIAMAGFLTIVAVLIIGATHGDTPVAASDSEAVARWNERVSSRVTADKGEAVTSEG